MFQKSCFSNNVVDSWISRNGTAPKRAAQSDQSLRSLIRVFAVRMQKAWVVS